MQKMCNEFANTRRHFAELVTHIVVMRAQVQKMCNEFDNTRRHFPDLVTHIVIFFFCKSPGTCNFRYKLYQLRQNYGLNILYSVNDII